MCVCVYSMSGCQKCGEHCPSHVIADNLGEMLSLSRNSEPDSHINEIVSVHQYNSDKQGHAPANIIHKGCLASSTFTVNVDIRHILDIHSHITKMLEL